ncbi:MAG: helix-turn-helix domain-containing protein [Ginsengibacter sp.]
MICLNQKYIINRIIITARSAKGLTEKEVAQELKIDESLYKEIELGISPTTSEMAETLENLYHVPLPGRVSIRGLCAAAGHGRHVINTHSDIRLLL